MAKSAKQILNEYCQHASLPPPVYVCTPDREKAPTGFLATLTVVGKTFSSKVLQKTKKAAENEASKLAVAALNLPKTSATTKSPVVDSPVANNVKDEVTNTVVPPKKKFKGNQPSEKDPEWIEVEKVEDIYQYLTDEVLAQQFKAFFHCRADQEKKPYPMFKITALEDKCGFTCIATYDGKEYQSLGPMMTRKQAEQSASEAALRALGDFPAISKDQYTIQVYKKPTIKV